MKWKKFIGALALPLAVGGLASLLSGGMDIYTVLNKPPLAPPGWLFPIVWSILYLLMGYASYRILEAEAGEEERRKALLLYGAQLIANFIWPLLFFGGMWLTASFLWLILLWIFILLTLRTFATIDEIAGNLLIPYILWVTFAGYLNFGFLLLN